MTAAAPDNQSRDAHTVEPPKAATSRPAIEAVIDLSAIAYNVGIIAQANPGAGVLAVVKADGYGHGAVPAARAALAGGAVELGVATIGEALELRHAGITAPILCWLHPVDAFFSSAIRSDIEIAVSSSVQLAEVVEAAAKAELPATVALKVDTGLHRNGIAEDDWETTVAMLSDAVADGAAQLRSVFCHFARADEPDHPLNDQQADRLRSRVAELVERGLPPQVVHASNSAAALTRPEFSFDRVRAGIAIYGCSPIAGRDFGLRPAMQWQTAVSMTKHVREGDGVSYGHTWFAPRDTTLALLPIGYADGLPRVASNAFDVLINGKRYPSVGRVCMDQCLVDVGDDGDQIGRGDTAIVFGAAPAPLASDLAEVAGTIDYEIVSGVRGRTIRHYINAPE